MTYRNFLCLTEYYWKGWIKKHPKFSNYIRQISRIGKKLLINGLGQHFGFKLNDPAFLRLTQIIPLKILQKHRTQACSTGSIAFWQRRINS